MRAKSLLRLVRTDQLHYVTRAQARLDIVDWIEGFYNRFRRHSSIGYQTPVGKELGHKAA